MATPTSYNSIVTEDVTIDESNFINSIASMRVSIQQHYSSLIDSIKQNEIQLLEELDSIEQTYIHEYQKYQTTIDELEKTKKQTLASLCSDDMKDLRDNMVKQVDEKIKSIKTKIDAQDVASFEWIAKKHSDIANIAKKVSEIGKLLVKRNTLPIDYKKKVSPIIQATKQRNDALEIEPASLSIDYNKKANPITQIQGSGTGEIDPESLAIDYKTIVNPIIKTCKQGSGAGEINYARGVATDNDTNNIYVVDHTTHRVCVFNSEGEFLFQFSGNSKNTVKMSHPVGIAIHENKVFVTQQSSHCIQMYNLDGTYIQQFVRQGTGKNHVSNPYGIAISPINGDIYVCEYNNNRVQIFSKDYKHKSFLGVNQLKLPRDVEVAQQKTFVLDSNSPCVHVYDYNNNLLKSIINKSGDGYNIKDAFSMFVDRDYNLILSDYGGGVVLIFSYTGEIIHQIGNTAKMFTHPHGVMVDTLGRLIVVSQQPDACIQIF